MADDRCPWCGEPEEVRTESGNVRYDCFTLIWQGEATRSGRCIAGEAVILRARVTRLESALRTIADTHGPGTIAGDAAREGLTN